MKRRRRELVLAGAALALARPLRAYDLDQVRSRGQIRFAVYRRFAPFSDDGKGIDLDIGEALAAALQVKAVFLPFDADENVDDDLRNMVWRGHYLGYGPADAMIHVPVDRAFIERNQRVNIFAPYYREKLQIARDTAKLPKLESLADLRGAALGAESDTLASIVLTGADGGRLREQVRHYKSTLAALDELRAGRLAAVAWLRSELLAGLHGAQGFEITDPKAPGVAPGGWALGLAVKAEYSALAQALQVAMNELVTSGRIEQIFARHKVDWLRP